MYKQNKVNNLGFVHMHMKCQLGETADTLAALRMAKEKNITTMAIVKESLGVRYSKAGIKVL